MSKEKLTRIKNKIKKHAPELTALAAIAGTIIVTKIIMQDAEIEDAPKASKKKGAPVLIIEDHTGEGWPEVTGDEKNAVLSAAETILNRIGSHDYILTVIPED